MITISPVSGLEPFVPVARDTTSLGISYMSTSFRRSLGR